MKKLLVGMALLGLAFSMGACGYKGKAKIAYDLCLDLKDKDAIQFQKEALKQAGDAKTKPENSKKANCKAAIDLVPEIAKRRNLTEDQVLQELIGMMSFFGEFN